MGLVVWPCAAPVPLLGPFPGEEPGSDRSLRRESVLPPTLAAPGETRRETCLSGLLSLCDPRPQAAWWPASVVTAALVPHPSWTHTPGVRAPKVAMTLPQLGIRNKARGQAQPRRSWSWEVPSPPAPPPSPSGSENRPGLRPSLGLSLPTCTLKGGDSCSGVNLLCRPAVRELGTQNKAPDPVMVLPRVGGFG